MLFYFRKRKYINSFCSIIKLSRVKPPTCFAVHENLMLLAVGYEDGEIQLYRGELTRGRSIKPKILQREGEHGSVTGLAFKTMDRSIILFSVSKNAVIPFDVTNKDRDVNVSQITFYSFIFQSKFKTLVKVLIFAMFVFTSFYNSVLCCLIISVSRRQGRWGFKLQLLCRRSIRGPFYCWKKRCKFLNCVYILLCSTKRIS